MASQDEVRRLVAGGYNELKSRYFEWTTQNDPRHRLDYLNRVLDLLPHGSRVLELGCGPGLPVAKAVSGIHQYLGADLSHEQLKLARRDAVGGAYVCADMSRIDFPSSTFDAVIAFYSIIHLPRETHASLFAKIHEWLKPEGIFVTCLGVVDNPGDVDAWVDDVPMFWSSYPEATYTDMLTDAGFEPIRNEVLANFEDGRDVYFYWFLGRKGASGSNS